MNSKEVVNEHFNIWSEENQNEKVFLLETEELDDSRSLAKLLLDLYEVKLYIPADYPQHDTGSNFYIEGPSAIGLWSNALNEYLLDRADKKLFLQDVLNRIHQTYFSKINTNDLNTSVSSEDDPTEEEDMADDDDDDDDIMFVDDIMSDDERIFTTEWELTVTRLKIQWRAKEAKIREELSKEATNDSNLEKFKSDQVKQIFSNPAASAILSNDLITVMEHEKQSGISSRPVDDNIFKWIVKLSNFKEDTALSKDLKILQEKFHYNYIELHMDFDMSLFPFYPPLVKVIRPRIKGINNENLISFDFLKIFQLSNWNPTSNMKSNLERVKEFLQNHCRLELVNCKNDLVRNPDGAYYDVEHSLLRLSVVSETPPRGASNYVPSYPEVETYLPKPSLPRTSNANNVSTSTSAKVNKPEKKFNSISAPCSPLVLSPTMKTWTLKSKCALAKSSSCIKKAKESASAKSVSSKMKDFWAKGTGFGSHRHSEGFDVQAFVLAQKEKDRQVEIVLNDILKDLQKAFTKQGDCVDNSVQPFIRRSSSGEESIFSTDCGNGHLSDWSNGNSSGDSIGTLNQIETVDEDIFNILESSALIPFLERYLGVDSFLEVSRHIELYQAIISIVNEIVKHRCLVRLMTVLPKQDMSLYSLLKTLSEKATFIITQLDKVSANGCVPGMANPEQETNRLPSTSALSSNFEGKNSHVDDEKIARALSQLFVITVETLKALGLFPHDHLTKGEDGYVGTDEDEGMDCGASLLPSHSSRDCAQNSDASLAQIYRKCLKPLQFESWKFECTGIKSHHFLSKLKHGAKVSQQLVIRVAQELSALSTSLPLDLGSSIFVRTDEENCTLLRVLITGPEGTPYSNGCFVFDIFFPNTFPKSPPVVHFQTTGASTVRFNPNLYNCGKVCLSLLGTWNGIEGEKWTEMSTVLQVLVSIQSLILVSEPFFNEPGYESFIGTSQGKAQSESYNNTVKINNIKFAMIDQIQNPSPGFQEVIKAHFYIKRKKIIQEVQQWSPKGNAELKKVTLELINLLNNLEAPNEDVAKLTSSI